MRTLADLLAQHARQRPEVVAHITGSGSSLTYGEWDRRAGIVAGELSELITGPEPRVVVWAGNDRVLDYVVLCVALQRMGGVPVPVSGSAGPEQVATIARNVGAVAIAALSGGAAVPDLLPLPEVADMLDVTVPHPPRPGSSDTAMILHTSGTTGSAKAVAVPHDNVIASLGLQRPGQGGPLVHGFTIGSNAAETMLVQPLASPGRPVVTMGRFDVRAFVALVGEHAVTAAVLTPPMATALAHSRLLDETSAGSLRSLRVGAAATPRAVLRRLKSKLPRAEVSNIYTTTETWPAATLMRYRDGDGGGETVGRPIWGTRVRVVDDRREPVAAGVVGRIEMLPPTSGRHGFPEQPAESGPATPGGGWIPTGDLGLLDDDGQLHVFGRADDVVNVGGGKVSAIAVEGRLAEHPAIQTAAVFAASHPTLGDYLAAAVVTRRPVTPVELRAFVAQTHGRSHAPRAVLLVSELPVNDGGKVDTNVLRKTLAEAAVPLYEEPADDVEAAIRDIVREVVGATMIGVNDEFLAAGGDSVSAAEAAAQIEERYGVAIPDAELETETVRSLAARVTATRRLSTSP